jgi:hypothetical protein
MITIRETEKRQYEVKREDRLLTTISLISSTVTNKFGIIAQYTEDVSKIVGDDFDNWYENYIIDYANSNYDAAILKVGLNKLTEYSDKYIDSLGINFNNYVSREKSSKNSILFDAEELEKIIRCSGYLKLYFTMCQDVKMKPPIKFHKEIYNNLVQNISNCEVVFKLFKLVSSKTYKYNISDKAMWEYIKLIHCKTIDMHVVSIFNFLLNNILVTCETSSNPIPYFSSVIDQSIKWILRDVYKESIIYSDTINTEDIHTISGKDNLLSYCYNDTIGKLVVESSNYLEEAGITDAAEFNETIGKLKEESLIAHYITYPILSKVLDIPYRYLRPIPVEHSYLLNILCYHYLPEDLRKEIPTISKLLLHYNIEKPISKTTYKIKNTAVFFETFKSFLSFKNQIFPYDLFSDLIGKISRNTYVDFTSGRQIVNFPLTKLETDMITFYNKYFSGELDGMFTKMRQEMEIKM